MHFLLRFFVIGCLLLVAKPCFSRSYPFLDYHHLDASAQALTHYTMSLIYDWQGSLEEAVQELKKAERFDRDNYAVALRLGANYGRMGHFEEASRQIEKAIQLNPDDLQARYLLAVIYSAQSKDEEAAKEYESILSRVVEDDPENPQAYLSLGQLYYSQGRLIESIGQFQKYLLSQPDDAEILFILGSLFLEIPDRTKAKEMFRRVVEVHPQHDGALNSLGYMYAEDGENLDEAQGLIQRALEIDPENGAYLDSLGWVYYQKGDYEKAVLFLERATEFMEDPVIYDHLGDAYFKLEKLPLALKNWEKSLALFPDQEEVVEKIENTKK